LLVPASISLDAVDPSRHTLTAVRKDLLLPLDADEATLAALAGGLCGGGSSALLAGRQADVATALATSLAPFRQGAAAPATAPRHTVALEFCATTGGVALTDRVIVDLSAPPGRECAASLGVAVAGEAGLSDRHAAAYAAAFIGAVAAARMGSGPVLPVEAAAGWVPRVEKAG